MKGDKFMKQENPKNSRKKVWLIVAIIALLAAIGVALALILPGLLQPQEGIEPLENPQVYFNLDRNQMLDPETTLSTRTPGEDGLYHIRFSIYGEVKEVSVINDKKLVNYIDTLDVLCPVLDENGVITDVQTADQHFLVTNNLFVKRMLNGNLEANSSTAMNGMDAKFPINEASGIYDCQPTAANPGTPSEAEWLDKIIAVTDKEKTYAHIYIVDNEAFEGEVAWRAAKNMYANNSTTRVPDENGVYTMEFFIDGKLVERKCKDKDKVDQIDKIEQFSCVVSLEYDEEGYIIDWFSPSFVLRGFELCKSYTVTAVENGTFSATYLMAGSKQGDTVEATYDDTCKIWDCCRGCKMDQPTCEKTTELKVGDIVSVYTDLDGKPIEIYVGLRQPDSPMYYNVTRMWSTANQATTRVPDEEGYYHIDLAVNGKVKEFKTKNVEHVNYIDSLYYFTVGLKTSGNIIKEVYAGNCVCGYTGAFVNRYVTNTVGTVVSVVLPPDLENGKNWLTSGKCEIYDVTGDYGTTMGQKTSLKVGDKVIGFINTESKLTHVYVTQHYNGDMTTAFNMNRQYSSATKGTARTPDANGYYVFDLAINGAVKQYKTKSKAMADFIDQQSPYVVGVKVSGDIIKDACFARSTVQYGAYAFTSMYVDNTRGNILSVYSLNLATRKDNATKLKITSKTKIYNVSGVYDKQPGEITKLRANDRVCAIANSATEEFAVIYVLARTVNTNDIYWNAARVTGTHVENGVTVTNRTPNSEGYYVFDLLYNGERINVKTKDLAMATQIDSYTQGFGLILDGDIVKQVLSFLNTANFNTVLGNYDITKVTKDTIYATRMRAVASDFGTEVAAKYNKNTKFINVISSSPDFGKIVTPKVGDRVVGYGGGDGGVNYVFITQESSHKKGAFSYCPHCDKTVFWDIWTSSNIADGMHCYLPNDQATTYTFGVDTDDKNCDMVLDLNGCTLTGSGLLVDVYDKLTIVDTVGGGKINGGGSGNIRVNEGATLTVLSGTITGGNTTLTGVGGNIYVNNGTVNVKGGTISNGVSYLGSNIYHTGSKGSVNISGGKVIGGSVYAENSKIINVSGNVEINNLIVKPGNIINVGKLASGASVTVKADGVFTNNGAASYIKNFKVTDAADAIAASGTALKYTNNSGTVVPSKPSVNDPLVLDADGMGMCMVCGEKVKWIPIHDGETIGVMNPAQPGYDAERFPDVDGKKYHFYIADDNMVSDNGDFLYTWNLSTVCLHLNGKTANIKGGIYGGNDSGINIMGEGTLNHLGTATVGTTKKVMFLYYTASLNLYGGTYESNENVFSFGNNSGKIKIAADAVVNETINLNQGKLTIDGNAQIQKVDVSGNGKVTINTDFTGSAVIDFAADKVTSGLVSASNGVATGDFAGQVITSEGNVIKNSDGRLAITATKVTPPAFTDEDITVVLPDVFDPANNDGKAFCEACQAIVVWTPFKTALGNTAANGHYYLEESFTHNDSYVLQTSATGNNFCINLNGKTLTTNKGFYLGNTSTVNFMGDGEVIYTGTSCLFETYSCTLKFYGGTYTANEENAKIQVGGSTYHTWLYNTPKFNGLMQYTKGSLHLVGSPEIKAVRFGNNANTKLYVEGTFGGKVDSITFDVGLTDNKIPAAFAYADAFTGSLTLDDGRGLSKDADSNQLVVAVPKDVIDLDTYDEAWCEACNKYIPKAEWTAFNSNLATNVENGKHYYVSESFNYTGSSLIASSAGKWESGTICVNLNGKTINTTGGIYLANSATLNLIGNGGTINYTGTSMLIEEWTAKFNIYGGTYNVPTGLFAKIQRNLVNHIYGDADINGKVLLDGGTNPSQLYIHDNASISELEVGTTGKLYVISGWAGRIDKATFAAALVENKIPAANAFAENFTGKIVMADGRGLEKDTASNQLIATERQPVEGVFEPWEYNGNAYCPVCKSIQTWTGITAAPGTVAADAHLYLEDNITYSTAGAFFVDVNSGKTLHLNMNGKNITSDVANVPTAYGPRVLGTLALLNTSETESIWTAGCATYGEFFLNSASGGLTLYDGVTLKASCTNSGQPIVGIMSGTFTMEGGTVDASGKDNVAAIQVRNTTNTAAFVMNGGEIISGTTGLAVRVGQSVAAGQANYAALNGGKISGNILARAGSVVLDKAGSPEAVSILEDAKLVVKETWTGNAVVGFTPAPVNGVVAAANGEATGAFTGGLFLADGNKLVKSANSNQLVVNEVIAAAAAMTFPTDGSSKVMDCPACGAKNATWTAYTGTAPTTASHLYVPANVEYSGNYMVVESGAAVICLHLNGKNITAKADGAYTFYVNKLNIMGNGVVTGNGTAASNAVGTAGAVFHSKGAGLINIYGGTYKKLSTNTTNPILTIGQNGGTVNMYGGIIDASGTTITGMPTAVALQGSATGATTVSAPAYFNMYGGEIKGGTTDSFGGAIRVGGISLDGKYADSAHFVMHGGKITGGIANDGGSIYADANCGTLTINGGIITGGKAKFSGGNIYVTKADLTIGAGAIIQNGVAGDPTDSTTAIGGGNIWFGTGTMTTAGKILNGECISVQGAGGNIFLFGTNVVTNFYMTGGEVKGGKLPTGDNQNYGCNIRAYRVKVLSVTGGEISGGIGGYAGADNRRDRGRNLYVGYVTGEAAEIILSNCTIDGEVFVNGGTLTLSGNLVIGGTERGLDLDNNITANVTGLTSGASIKLSGLDANTVFSGNCGTDAATLAKRFVMIDNNLTVDVDASNCLYVKTK